MRSDLRFLQALFAYVGPPSHMLWCAARARARGPAALMSAARARPAAQASHRAHARRSPSAPLSRPAAACSCCVQEHQVDADGHDGGGGGGGLVWQLRAAARPGQQRAHDPLLPQLHLPRLPLPLPAHQPRLRPLVRRPRAGRARGPAQHRGTSRGMGCGVACAALQAPCRAPRPRPVQVASAAGPGHCHRLRHQAGHAGNLILH